MALRFPLLAVWLALLAAAAYPQAPTGTLPTVVAPIAATGISAGGIVTVDLSTVFGLPGISGPLVQFSTVFGPVNVELFPQAAPLTTANFLGYVNSGAYTKTIFNRAVAGFVAQGGTYNVSGNSLYAIQTGPPVTNEFGLANTRGTLAMTKLANEPDSATCTWFFNLSDNSATLNPEDGGYTVFGQVIGTGMAVIDQVGNAPVVDLSSELNADFTETPVINYTPPNVSTANLILISSIAPITVYGSASTAGAVLSFSATSGNPAVATASVAGTILTLQANSSGTAEITVTATDSNGNQASTGFRAIFGGSLAIVQQPGSQTVTSGTTVVFALGVAAAPAATFQWFLNGAPLAGATAAHLVVGGATAANAGRYTCVATNLGGSVTSQAAVLTVAATANPGRLGNLSVLTMAGNGAQPLTVGFEVGGAGTTGQQTLLIRGDGPLLAAAPFNQSGTLADPVIALFAQGSSSGLASDDNWGTDQAAVTAAEANTYAYPLATGSLDAAWVSTLAPGAYSVQVTGNPNGSGLGSALAEVYDDTLAGAYTLSTPRLVNLSCLARINAGGLLTAGFVIGGATAKTMLVRASGPALAMAPFNLAGTMPDPQLTVHTTVNSQDEVLAASAGWGGDPQLAAAAASVYAFAWTVPGSNDSAVLLTLSPGNYTVQVSSVSGTAGTALVEVYEIP